jgi:circadian clock protein KaiB
VKPDRRSRDGQVALKLYVAGRAPYSVQALANLEAILAAYADPDTYRLEVIDVLEEPLRALEAGVFVTPALIQVWPVEVHIVGALNDRERVARLLGLASTPGEREVET